jgi:hypothetical protein
MALISADVIPTACEELASSPSLSEMLIAKENRLSGESYSYKMKKISYSKLSVDNTKSGELDDLLASR